MVRRRRTGAGVIGDSAITDATERIPSLSRVGRMRGPTRATRRIRPAILPGIIRAFQGAPRLVPLRVIDSVVEQVDALDAGVPGARAGGGGAKAVPRPPLRRRGGRERRARGRANGRNSGTWAGVLSGKGVRRDVSPLHGVCLLPRRRHGRLYKILPDRGGGEGEGVPVRCAGERPRR